MRATFILLLVVGLLSGFRSPISVAAEDESGAERLAAERFLQVLIRRPRPGTALDRVYHYHVQSGTLDTFIDEQAELANQDDQPGARHFLIGLLNLQRGHEAEAVKSLQTAEPELTDDAMVSFYLGKALELVGRGNAAAEAFERAIERKPARNEALLIYTELGRFYQRARQNELALKVWQRLEATFPGDTRVAEQIAETLADEGQLNAALERYLALAQSTRRTGDSRSITYRIAAAELKQQIGKHEEALADFEAILSKLRPTSWLYTDVRRRIEASFLRTGNYADLADYYAEQVAESPDQIQLRLRLGRSLAKAGRLAEAETTMRQTIAIAGESIEARFALIDILKSAGKARQAAEQLEVLTRLDPENPDVLVQLGNTWLDDQTIDLTERRDRAAKAWIELADSRRDNAVITSQVASRLRRIECVDEALKWFHRSIEIAPDQPQHREYLGEYLHSLGRTEESIEVWKRIVEGERKSRENLIRLAEVYHRFDQSEHALETFAEAAQMDPTFPQRMRFAAMLGESKKYNESLTQLDEAERIAESPEQTDQILQARISVYSKSGELEEQITRLTEQAKSADDYRTLALMLEAASRIPDAVKAIETARSMSSEDQMILSIAAELYRKALRYADAIDVYRVLLKPNSPYQSSYLQRIAGLQMRLGQVDAALSTAEELIALQPGNPEFYRLYASQCFQVGRSEEGIEKLRQALRAAPRDRDARAALATALADRFQTDEAIEIVWQLMVEAHELIDQRPYVRQLAQWYDRKGDFQHLLNRLERHGLERSDTRTAWLLISHAQRSVNDFGAAKQSLVPLLANNPRDAQLLERMVDLSAAADDNDEAIEYQTRLVELADTPAHRRRLLNLIVDAGRLDHAEAIWQRLDSLRDPASMIRLIDGVLGRGESDHTIRLCESLLQEHPDLWEVRVRLAGVYIQQERNDDAIKQLDLVDAMNIDTDEPSQNQLAWIGSSPLPPAAPTPPVARGTGPTSYQNRLYALSHAFGLGRYASNRSPLGLSSTLLSADDFGQATYLSQALRMIIAVNEGRLDEYLDENLDLKAVAASGDREAMWRAYHDVNLSMVFGNAVLQVRREDRAQQSEDYGILKWRLAELDAQNSFDLVHSILSTRSNLRSPRQLKRQPTVELEPLEDWQFKIAAKAIDLVGLGPGISANLTMSFKLSLYQEYLAAGRTNDAKKMLAEHSLVPETLDEAIESLQFHMGRNALDESLSLLKRTRAHLPEWIPQASKASISELSRISDYGLNTADAPREMTEATIDLGIAGQAVLLFRSGRYSSSSSQDTGIVTAQTRSGMNSHRTVIEVPFCERILPSSLAQQFYSSSGIGNLDPPIWLFSFLDRGQCVLTDAPLAGIEAGLRTALAVYARWWTDDLSGAYQRAVAASEEADRDDAWSIERARMAAELGQPAASLEALDQITPIDQDMLRVRELAAINLATKLGKLKRAKTAARRLVDMRLDNKTELVLADQLHLLGMRDMASAFLKRIQSRGGLSITDQLRLADQFVKQDNLDAAAEVAFKAIARIHQSRQLNATSRLRLAAEVLIKANRMDAFLEEAEQRINRSPNSIGLKTELAQLYVAIGRRADAAKLFQNLAPPTTNAPRKWWTMGERLASSGNHAAAVDKYLAAIQQNPQSLDRTSFRKLETSSRISRASMKVYRELLAVDLKNVDPNVVGQLLTMYQNERPGMTSPNADYAALANKLMRELPIGSLGAVLQYLSRTAPALSPPDLHSAITRVFFEDQVYEPTCPFWANNSYGSDGQIYSPLELCLSQITEGSDLDDQVRDQIRKRIDSEPHAAIARWLLVIYDFPKTPVDQMHTNVNELIRLHSSDLHQSHWWLLGQILLERDELSSLAVKALVQARKAPGELPSNGMEHGSDLLLVSALIKTDAHDAARTLLMQAYNFNNRQRIGASSSGNADRLDLQSQLKFAKRMLDCRYPVDAIRILNRALAESQRLMETPRRGVAGNFRHQFAVALQRGMDEFSLDASARFLSFTTDASQPDPVDSGSGLRFDWVPLIRTDQTQENDATSLAMLAIMHCQDSEAGRKTLSKFSDQLALQIETYPDDWSLRVADVMLGLIGDSDDSEARINALLQSLPPLPSLTSQVVVDLNALIGLHVVVKMCLTSDDDEVVRAGLRLADYVIDVSKRSGDVDVLQELTMLQIGAGGDSPSSESVDDSLMRLLDALASPVEQATARSMASAKELLKVAKTAMETESWNVAAEAINRTLRFGPPRRSVDKAASSANTFLLSTQRAAGSGSVNLSVDDLDHVLETVGPILTRLNELVSDDEASLDTNRLMRIYRQIVIPESRPGEIFPYHANLRDVRFRTELAKDVAASNLSGLWVHFAKQTDRLDELQSILDEQPAKMKSDAEWTLLQLLVAIAREDAELAGKSINQLETNLDDTEAFEIKLHAIMAAEELDTISDATLKLQTQVIAEASRSREFADKAEYLLIRFSTSLLKNERLTDEQAKQVLDNLVASVQLRYERFGSTYAQDRLDRTRAHLAEQLFSTQRFRLAGLMLRELAWQQHGLQTTATSYLPLSLRLATLSAELRYRVLHEIVLGDPDDRRVADPAHVLLAVQPPGALRNAKVGNRAIHSYDLVQTVPIGGPEFPITSAGLQLAHAAVEVGRTAKLVETLASLVGTPGDETDAMIGIVELTQWTADGLPTGNGEIEAIRERLLRISQRMAETMPEQTIDQPMPINASIFAVRLHATGKFEDECQSLLSRLHGHSIHRKLGMVAGFYGGMSSAAGLRQAIDAKAGLSLRHFIDVPMPDSGNPITQATRSIYSFDESTLHHVGGANQSVLMWKYPVVGDFGFGYVDSQARQGGCGIAYDGDAYIVKPSAGKISGLSLVGRGEIESSYGGGNDPKDQRHEVVLAGDRLTMNVDGLDVLSDARSNTMPFPGVLFQTGSMIELSDLRFDGAPTIPRQVRLIEPTLRGWSCSILGGSLIKPSLAVGFGEKREVVEKSRSQAIADASREMSFYVEPQSDELRSGRASAASNPGGQRHIHYLRPLLDGETISYDSFYVPEQMEIHPTVGRVAVLLRKNGVNLRWLPMAQSFESDYDVPLHEVSPETGTSRPEKVGLQANQWNQVRVIGRATTAVIELNGEKICEVELSEDRRFGLLGEKDRSSRVRNLVLSGDWPETLPENLMDRGE